MQLVRRTIKDKTLTELIKRFLKSGVIMPNGLLVSTEEGSPQGGNLSPLLANIYLHEFDTELEARGHKFVRYADDVNIYVKSRKAAERVMESSVAFLEGKQMKLKVNSEKSAVGSPTELRFLGFTLHEESDFTVNIMPHERSIMRFKDKIRAITKRNRGRSSEQILSELKTYTRGWMGYYGISGLRYLFERLDGWVRRKMRTYMFKQWKNPKNRIRQLVNIGKYLGMKERTVGNRAKALVYKSGVWSRTANYINLTVTNRYMSEKLGMYFMVDDWEKIQERFSNRPLPNGTMGGVRGRLST